MENHSLSAPTFPPHNSSRKLQNVGGLPRTGPAKWKNKPNKASPEPVVESPGILALIPLPLLQLSKILNKFISEAKNLTFSASLLSSEMVGGQRTPKEDGGPS